MASERSQSILMQENQPVKDIDLDLLQDVADQGQHMLTIGAHVPGLASGSDFKIRSIQTFLLT